MLTGPKKNEYLGLIAPPGKKAMYLGYVNIPVGLGVAIGSFIAGHIYGAYGEKANLAPDHLAAHPALVARAAQAMDWSDDLERVATLGGIERGRAFGLACEALGAASPECAERLREAFANDRGQVVNAALMWLALHPEFAARMEALAAGAPVDEALVARRVGALPGALGVNRGEALARVRHLMGEAAPADEHGLIVALWSRFAAVPELLDNLALEHLAQATPLIRDRVRGMDFGDPRATLAAIGLGRTKSFDALSVSLGASDEEVRTHLAQHFAAMASEEERVYAYLMGLKHLRFLAVARRDWSGELGVLGQLVGDGAAALAGDQDAVQAALDQVDWTRHPEAAAYLLVLNPSEARALAAAELKNAKQATTKLLWDTYHPQYKVWIHFAAIGVLATIALGVFGLLARRWQDMNA